MPDTFQTIDLINFLGNYVTEASPSGYALPAFPWFVYQVRADGRLLPAIWVVLSVVHGSMPLRSIKKCF